jgi:hypothetical protein
MKIRELVRRDSNEAKLGAHRIAWREVEELVNLDQWVTSIHPDYPEQVRIMGQTMAGRWITIVLDPTDEADVWRPVAGWPSEDHEIVYHRQEMP